jgi:hypothetical protein
MDDDRECLPRASVGNFGETPSQCFFLVHCRVLGHLLPHTPVLLAYRS